MVYSKWKFNTSQWSSKWILQCQYSSTFWHQSIDGLHVCYVCSIFVFFPVPAVPGICSGHRAADHSLRGSKISFVSSSDATRPSASPGRKDALISSTWILGSPIGLPEITVRQLDHVYPFLCWKPWVFVGCHHFRKTPIFLPSPEKPFRCSIIKHIDSVFMSSSQWHMEDPTRGRWDQEKFWCDSGINRM